jgi:uncharacterized protein YehS (DUF1456 family)
MHNPAEWRPEMARNELLRTICSALEMNDETVIQVFGHAGRSVGVSMVTALQKSEDQDDYIPCSDPVFGFFLDGLIIQRRGQKEGAPLPADKPVAALNNNDILKKLRIALDLKEEELLEIFTLAGQTLSKHELTALFRKQGHKHYKECSNQVLAVFIKGLKLRFKG